MCAPAPPEAPDVQETASAATSTNLGTAIANTTMGQVDQYSPTGSLTYDQTGTTSWTDPYTDETYDIPTYSSTTSLSPEEQAVFDVNQSSRLGMGQLAGQQIGFLKDYMATPANYDTSEIEGRLSELASQRLDPRMEQQRAALEQRLANQGLTPGSAAWEAEMTQFGQTQNDAYNQLMLTGRGQALNELMATRNQPINEITALLSGSQVSQPNFQMANPQGMATTDVGGLINQNYNQQYGNYQNEMSQYNQMMGGLFGMAGAFI